MSSPFYGFSCDLDLLPSPFLLNFDNLLTIFLVLKLESGEVGETTLLRCVELRVLVIRVVELRVLTRV